MLALLFLKFVSTRCLEKGGSGQVGKWLWEPEAESKHDSLLLLNIL